MWNQVKSADGQRREEELRTRWWKKMLASGSALERFGNTHDSAWLIVDELL
jgi:hypothetical protein